jgi:hypothetical protein
MARMVARVAHLHLQSPGAAVGGDVSATTLIAPSVEFFSGRQESFVGDPGSWHRVTAREAAQMHTGGSHATGDRHLGVFVIPISNGLIRVGLDLWRLDMNLRPPTVERLERRLRSLSAKLTKSQLRYFDRHTHISRTVVDVVVMAEEVDAWKDELSGVLTDPGSFEAL